MQTFIPQQKSKDLACRESCVNIEGSEPQVSLGHVCQSTTVRGLRIKFFSVVEGLFKANTFGWCIHLPNAITYTSRWHRRKYRRLFQPISSRYVLRAFSFRLRNSASTLAAVVCKECGIYRFFIKAAFIAVKGKKAEASLKDVPWVTKCHPFSNEKN